jgi:hypothetical protein
VCGSPAFHDGRELTGTPGPESELGATRCVGGATGRRGWRSSDVVAESGCGGWRSAGRISGGGGDAEWDRRWRVGGGGFRVGLRDGARGWGACGVGRCVGAAVGIGAAGASVRFVSGSAAFVGVLVVGHRWAPCRIRVVVGTRSSPNFQSTILERCPSRACRESLAGYRSARAAVPGMPRLVIAVGRAPSWRAA